MLKFLVSQKLYLTSLFGTFSLLFFPVFLSQFCLPYWEINIGLVLRYHLVILSRFENTFQTTKWKLTSEETNYNGRQQLQFAMNSNNWTTTNDYLKHEWQQKPTPKDWKWFKYAQNNQKNPRTKECCNGWLFKNKIASSKQQNNSWTV